MAEQTSSVQVVAPQIKLRKLTKGRPQKKASKTKRGKTKTADITQSETATVSVYTLREHMTCGGSKAGRYNDQEVFDCSSASVMQDTETGTSLKSGLFQAILTAYSGHHMLHLRPDDLLLAMGQAVSAHLQVEENAEKYRHKFVDHEGQNLISVSVDHFKKADATLLDWSKCVQLIVNNLEVLVKGDTSKLLQNDFSTTDDVSKTASQIVLMDAMKRYFRYELRMVCGIPSVTLHGTLSDWERLVEKAQALENLDIDLEWWLDRVIPVLEKLVDTYRGDIDQDWWSRVVNKYRQYGSGGGFGEGDIKFSGWICAFFPYNQQGLQKAMNYMELEDVPTGLVECPFVMDKNASKTDNLLVAGSCGVSLTEDGGVAPCIGWLVKKDLKQKEGSERERKHEEALEMMRAWG